MSVTGIVCGPLDAPTPVIVIVPLYVPMASPAGFTATVKGRARLRRSAAQKASYRVRSCLADAQRHLAGGRVRRDRAGRRKDLLDRRLCSADLIRERRASAPGTFNNAEVDTVRRTGTTNLRCGRGRARGTSPIRCNCRILNRWQSVADRHLYAAVRRHRAARRTDREPTPIRISGRAKGDVLRSGIRQRHESARACWSIPSRRRAGNSS